MNYYLAKIVIDEKHETFKLIKTGYILIEDIESELTIQYPYAQEIIVYETLMI